ncbi:MAG TPA: hypothetical protein VGQ78_00740, partial [Vicinamibacteria bacterium]|nr:hypothetical protein [Vicinamibacteria bacterium]
MAALLGGVLTFTGGGVAKLWELHAARQQHRHELRERSYSRLMGLRLPWITAWKSYATHAAVGLFRERRFALTADRDDERRAEEAYASANTAGERLSTIQRELFETLGDIGVSYESTPELRARLQAVYRFKGIVPTVVTAKTPQEVDQGMGGVRATVQKHVD